VATTTLRLEDRCRAIELLVLDVDGVLTEGSVILGDAGEELKRFHVRDGSGLKFWRLAGRRTALITGRSSRLVERRAAELGIGLVYQGVDDKVAALAQVLKTTGLEPEQVCTVGDDLPDLPVLAASGLAVAVADACTDVRMAAHYVTQAPGGRGAVRETIELLLRCQGHWQTLLNHYRERRL
jgi:3-deoxy-D-manno-octulosonate 8-phosphate phosphatase (KDO 8-P phosphatase)